MIKTAEQLMTDIAEHRKANILQLSCQFEMHVKEYVSVAGLLMETYDNIQVNYTKTEEFYNVIVTIGC